MKTLNLLNSFKTRKIEIPYYLEKNFLDLGYHKLPTNIILKKIYLFMILRILRFPKIFLRKLFTIKIHYKEPIPKDNLIFDKADHDQIKLILPLNSYKVINSRVDDIDEIYLTPKILCFMFLNLFTNNFRISYLISLTKVMNPKQVITFNDHSTDFSLIGYALRKSNIKFIGIQQAGRSKIYTESFKDFNIHIPYYYTIGEFEKDIIPKYLKDKSMIKPIGSLKVALAKEFFKKKLIESKRLFDICVISEPRIDQSSDLKGYKNLQEQRALIIRHVVKYCKKFNKKYIITGKHDINDSRTKVEELTYKYYLKDLDFKITFNSKKEFGSYKNILMSEIVVGATSSMLQESFGFKKKILYCDYENDIQLYPYLTGICVLKDKSYENFEKRVSELLSLDYSQYLDKIDQNIDYIYNTKIDTLDFLRNELKSFNSSSKTRSKLKDRDGK